MRLFLQLEVDVRGIDQTLKTDLTKIIINPWQAHKETSQHQVHNNWTHEINNDELQVSWINAVEARFVYNLVTTNGELDYLQLITNHELKYKRRKLYSPIDFCELTLESLVDTGALSSAIPESHLRKIRVLAPQLFIKDGPAPNFQILVTNGQLETTKSTVELNFEIGDIEFHEILIVMEKPHVQLYAFHSFNRLLLLWTCVR